MAAFKAPKIRMCFDEKSKNEIYRVLVGNKRLNRHVELHADKLLTCRSNC